MRDLSLAEAAFALGISPTSLRSKRYRDDAGIPSRLVLGELIFLESEINDLLERNLKQRGPLYQVLPPCGGRWPTVRRVSDGNR